MVLHDRVQGVLHETVQQPLIYIYPFRLRIVAVERLRFTVVNAHKLRICDLIQWIVQAFAPRRRRLFMRKYRYYEQLEAVSSNN